VFAHWRGKTLAEERAQIAGHSVVHGHVGYLREAYDGEPYAIPMLVPEAFEREVEIPAARLRERLERVLCVATRRQVQVYSRNTDNEDAKAALKSFVDFVELCERKERETGKPCRIAAHS
jgi:DNA polymerase III sliding clamp (beta) subunit (PCNA family)